MFTNGQFLENNIADEQYFVLACFSESGATPAVQKMRNTLFKTSMVLDVKIIMLFLYVLMFLGFAPKSDICMRLNLFCLFVGPSCC